MLMKVHCPGCQSPLRVPETSAGRAARCPVCKTKFQIPSSDQMLEDTISTWIEFDVEKEQARRSEETGANPALSPVKSQGAAGASRAEAAAVPVTAAPQPAGLPPRFPARLHLEGPQPHLVVEECSQGGVRLAFDAVWLEHDLFRASMPQRCAFTGTTDRGSLRVRPLAFVDRADGSLCTAQEIEAAYEGALPAGATPYQVMQAMPPIVALPPPFNHPMPYYIDGRHTQFSLRCGTASRPDGGYTCLVHVPDGATALEWLQRVNGVCGPEFWMLDRELGLTRDVDWEALPETYRQRLVVWCRFEARERFRLYFSDAEFGQRDVGLAGLVLTDRRLIYHKFHHTGSVDLAQGASFAFKSEGRFSTISVHAGEHRTRLVVKLATADAQALMLALSECPNVQVTATE